MSRRGWAGLAAVLALGQAAPAFAVDNLIASPRGDDKTFTLYYLHSKPDFSAAERDCRTPCSTGRSTT